MALTGLAIAAALAVAKDKMVDEPQYQKQKQLAANTQRLSPWTGLTAQNPKPPNWMGQAIQYGATGAAMGANYGKGATAAGENAATNTYAGMSPTPAASAAVNPSATGSMYGNPYGFFGVSPNPLQP